MNPGKLRHRITFQERTTTQDSYGQPLLTWTDVATVWGAVEPLNGRELMAAEAVQSEITHQVVIRYRPGITAKMRVLYGTRVFDIQNVLDENERHRMLTLLCLEGLSDG